RLNRRSRSSTPASARRNSSRAMVCFTCSSTASSRWLISIASNEGRSNHARSSRLPMGVTVAPIERNKVTPASVAANSGSISSRLHRDRIEHQAILPLVEAYAVHVIERAALGGAHVVEDRSGCRGCRRLSRQAKAFERKNAEVVFEERNGMVGGKDPVLQRS